MRKDIVINADDFGYSSRINEGIHEVYDKKRLSSVSVMVNGDGFSDAVKRLKKEPRLGRGLHITLTTNSPVSEPKRIRSLLNDSGSFYQRGELFLANVMRGKIHKEDLEVEIRNQIEEGLQNIDRVDHINSHMHVHMYPPLFSLFNKLAEEYNIPAVRLSDEKLPINYNAFKSGYLWSSITSKNIVKKSALSLFSRLSTSSNRVVTDSFSGVIHMGNMNEENITCFLESNIHSPVEFCVHPGFCDPKLSEINEPLIGEREIDLNGLCSRGVAKILHRDYNLVRFRDIAEKRRLITK